MVPVAPEFSYMVSNNLHFFPFSRPHDTCVLQWVDWLLPFTLLIPATLYSCAKNTLATTIVFALSDGLWKNCCTKYRAAFTKWKILDASISNAEYGIELPSANAQIFEVARAIVVHDYRAEVTKSAISAYCIERPAPNSNVCRFIKPFNVIYSSVHIVS